MNKDIEQSDAGAKKWLDKMSELQYELGKCYWNGVPENQEEAAMWLRVAAEQGNIKAQYCLGMCYLNGRGIQKDEAEAVKWLRELVVGIRH